MADVALRRHWLLVVSLRASVRRFSTEPLPNPAEPRRAVITGGETNYGQVRAGLRTRFTVNLTDDLTRFRIRPNLPEPDRTLTARSPTSRSSVLPFSLVTTSI